MKHYSLIFIFVFRSAWLITDYSLKIKGGHNLEWQTLETMKLLGSTKKLCHVYYSPLDPGARGEHHMSGWMTVCQTCLSSPPRG